MFTQGRQTGKTSMMYAMVRALYEEIFTHRCPEPRFMANQAPYRYTREYGKRSNWIKRKR